MYQQRTRSGLSQIACFWRCGLALACAALAVASAAAAVPDTSADVLPFDVENSVQLRHAIGAPGVIAIVNGKRFDWDAASAQLDNGASVLRPDLFDGAGRWRLAPTNAGDVVVDGRDRAVRLPGCADPAARPVKLVAADPTADVATRFDAAIAQAAATRCPIIVEPGVYPVGRDISIAASHITVFCKEGAVFRKTATANAIWLKGEGDRMIGRCEIDGGNKRGSGLIVAASARDTDLTGLYVHDNQGHGVLNKGRGTRADSVRTERNTEVGFANDSAKDLTIISLVSRLNGEEGLTIDNPGTASVSVLGGYIAGNCRIGGVGNIGVDAAVDVSITGPIVKDPGAACGWNLTAQNNVGDTRRLRVRGGVFAGALKGDVHFRTNPQRHYAVRESSVEAILSSSPRAVVMDDGSVDDHVITSSQGQP